MRLYMQKDNCKTSYEDRVIRDQLVWGIFNKEIQERILSESNLTTDNIIKYYQSIELSKRSVQILNNEQEIIVNMVKK